MKKLAFLSILALVGCGAGSVQSGDDVNDGADSLSSVTAGFVTLQRDQRRCAAPQCGGFWLSQPSHPTLAPIYVSGLDFSSARGLVDADQQRVLTAPDGEALLYGKLSRASATTGTKTFLVQDAYRGMPGRTVGASDKFYALKNTGKECVTAPCNALVATRINSTAQPKEFTTLSVASASTGFVDQAWLSHRAIDDGAIVTGTFQTGTQYPAGSELVLDATQVFVHLPEMVGPCPQLAAIYCPAPETTFYTRTPDRCVVPQGCGTVGICPFFVPACAPGYTQSSWMGTTGCHQYACDPSWLFDNN